MKCDKTSADPAKHVGPFKHIQGSGELVVGRCEACRNTVFRPKRTSDKQQSAKPKTT